MKCEGQNDGMEEIDVAVKTFIDNSRTGNRVNFIREAFNMKELHNVCIVKMIGISEVSSVQVEQH